MHDRTESEMAGSVDVAGLDPTERGGDETVCRDWLGPQSPHLDQSRPRAGLRSHRVVVMSVARRTAPSARRNQVTTSPLAESTKRWPRRNPSVDAQRRALDMKTGTGAKFTCEAGIDPAGKVGAVRQIDEAKFVGEVRIRLLQPIEVIGDREVLGHVALPGRHRATIGLGPIRHDAISVHPCKFNAVRTGTFARRFLRDLAR